MLEKINFLKTLKVLVIEDEKELRTVLEGTLTKLGVNFETAENGQEGLDKVRKSDYDLIITDINMPVMDGLTFIEKSRQEGVTSEIIIMSAHTEQEYIDKARKLDIQNYLLKPFDFMKFIHLVSEIKSLKN